MLMATMVLLLVAFTISGCGRNDLNPPADHPQHTQSNTQNDFADSSVVNEDVKSAYESNQSDTWGADVCFWITKN